MPILREMPGYPTRDRGTDPSVTLGFQVIAEDDDTFDDCYAFLLAETPEVVDALLRNRVRFKHVKNSHNVYEAEIDYRIEAAPSSENDPVLTWELTPITTRITTALEVVSQHTLENLTARPSTGALGVTPAGEVEGAEIHDTEEKLNIRVWIPADLFTPKMRTLFRSFRRAYNNAPWKSFATGEALFLGVRVTGEATTDEENLLELTFDFLISESLVRDEVNNTGGVVIGNIPPFTKLGHHLLEITHGEAVDPVTRKTFHQPIQADVLRVYSPKDFKQLGLGK